MAKNDKNKAINRALDLLSKSDKSIILAWVGEGDNRQIVAMTNGVNLGLETAENIAEALTTILTNLVMENA